MKSVLVLLVAANVAMATVMMQGKSEKDPERCCLPKTFQTGVGGFEAYAIKKTTVNGLVRYFADYAMKAQEQVAAIRIMDMEDWKPKQRLVMDYGKQALYNITNVGCIKSNLSAPLPDLCIPESAVYLSSFTFGGGEQSVLADLWRIVEPSLNLDETVTFTRNCYPISNEAAITMDNVNIFVTSGYTNFVNEITDPSLFEIPEGCDDQIMRKAAPWRHFTDLEHLPMAKFTRL